MGLKRKAPAGQQQAAGEAQGPDEIRALINKVKTLDNALSEEGVVLVESTPEPGDEGEWFTPGPGDVLEKVQIESVLFVTKDGEAPRPAYGLRVLDAQAADSGKLYLVSEKKKMRVLRALNLGAIITIAWDSKSEIGNERERWNMEIRVFQNGPGRRIIDAMKLEHAKLSSDLLRNFSAPRGEDVPF